MEVSFETALKTYSSFPQNLQTSTLHPEFLKIDALRHDKCRSVYFVYESRSDIYYHPFQVLPVDGTPYFDIQSPYGYGGPIATTRSETFLNDAWENYRKWCKANGILAEFIRFHPLLEN